MKSEQFAYWLQGFAELTPGQVPSKEQWDLIVEHLAEVFDKVTPPMKMGSSITDPTYGAWAGIPPSCNLGSLARGTTLLADAVAQSTADSALSSRVSAFNTGETENIKGITALVC